MVRPVVAHLDVDVRARRGAAGGCRAASTMRRTPSATSVVSTTSACCQRSVDWAAIAQPSDPGVRGPPLGLQHPVEDAAYPHAAGVDVQAVELVVRVGVDGPLLGDQHLLVLAEDAVHAVAQLGGDGLAVEAVVAHEGPEVVAGPVGLGRDRVHHVAVDALAAVALGGAGAGLGDADVDADRRGCLEVDDLPAVDAPLEVGELVAHVLQPERRRPRCRASSDSRSRAGRRGSPRTRTPRARPARCSRSARTPRG